LVVAVYGDWGSGKTSVKNLVLEHLHTEVRHDAPTVTVLDFNPWMFTPTEDLQGAFFGELGILLRRLPGTTPARRTQLSKRWINYASRLGIRTWSPIVESWHSLTDRLSTLIARKALTVREQKDGLTRTLAQLDSPFLIVMDDVDRLTTDQVKAVFQLVKGNADFPNIVYLLLFQRDIVERQLTDGAAFLEKIIQVGFRLPEANRRDIDTVLFESLDRILANTTLPQPLDTGRWANLYLGAVQSYFASLRHVYRFASTLAFHVNLLTRDEILEVDFIDLVAIETLRVFEPELYQALPQHKAMLTSWSRGLESEADERTKYQSLIEKVPAHRRAAAAELLQILFPGARRVIGGVHFGADFADESELNLRVGRERYFERYFAFAIGRTDIPDSMVKTVLANVGDGQALRDSLTTIVAEGKIAELMERLEVYKDKISLRHAEPFLAALFDVGDSLPVGELGFFSIEPLMHASRLLYWYLAKEADNARRIEILRSTLGATTGFLLPTHFLLLASRPDSEGRRREWRIGDDDFPTVRDIVVEKIRAAAADGRLANSPHLGFVLYRWREWDEEGNPRHFVQGLVETTGGALRFLSAIVLVSTSTGFGDRTSQREYWIRLKNIEDFVAWERIEDQIQGLDVLTLPERERNAVAAFRFAVARRRRGLPDLEDSPRASDSGRGENADDEPDSR
jgi:predicted KAP-like P-loop ATPase